MSQQAVAEFTSSAISVLNANWRDKSTIPSQVLYPHQWSWDSAFIAIGLSHFNQSRAELELETLFSAQWSDGRVPHIVFNHDVSPTAYFPSSDFWQSSLRGGPVGVETSGIVQPPIHARAALDVYRNSKDLISAKRFLIRLYPKLVAWHDYLLSKRLDAETGLVFTVHPWESGLDNSPLWDKPLSNISVRDEIRGSFTRRDLQHVDKHDRPSDEDYARFVQIAADYRALDYDDGLLAGSSSYRVIDPMFSALLAWSEEALGGIATAIGLDGSAHMVRAEQLTAGLVNTLFDPELGVFVSLDSLTREYSRKRTVSGLIPIVVAGMPMHIVSRLLETLRSEHFGLGNEGVFGVPSYDLLAQDFNSRLYWRGPSWLNTSWLVWRGLHDHGLTKECEALRENLIEMTQRSGFFEYFDPLSSKPHGSPSFSWTASLVLDLAVSK